MSKYTVMTRDMQEQAIRNRLLQSETNHLEQTMNLKIAEGWPDDAQGKQASIDQAKNIIAQLEVAIQVCNDELASLGKDDKKKTDAKAE